ncbi:MAG TPA: DUF6458 family protein [Gaiellaceae bacterium]|nr:DUF6458 family protein [Gaiellaceae bacterium]
MGFGVGLILTAVGAILAWAVTATTSGFNVHTVGYILLVVGIVGMLISLVFWSSWAGPGYFSGGRRTYVDDGVAPVRRRRRVIDEEIV